MHQTLNHVSDSAAEISAVSLFKLLRHVEKCKAASTSINVSLEKSSVHVALTPYADDFLNLLVEAIFNRTNEEFYAAYRGYGPEKLFDIVLSKKDLRPLAYRALFYTERHLDDEGDSAAFSPRFAQALLQLERHWDADFLQAFKDVAGNISAHSIMSARR